MAKYRVGDYYNENGFEGVIFALDSTAVVGSVALCRDGKPLACFTVKNGNTHSETLLPLAETMFKALKMSVDDIDIFSCSAGPGSVTGVRIGAATVKGLAFTNDIPCVGVSTLEAIAENLFTGKTQSTGKGRLTVTLQPGDCAIYEIVNK